MYLSNVGAKLSTAGLEYADNTLELFSQRGGADWWYDNGNEGDAIFYLDEDSACIQALQVYLEEKWVDIVGKSEEETDRYIG